MQYKQTPVYILWTFVAIIVLLYCSYVGLWTSNVSQVIDDKENVVPMPKPTP
jgi:hypothetical protein